MAEYERDVVEATAEEEEENRSSKGRGGEASTKGAKKPRGRPPGSKNKPKPPLIITRENQSAMRPLVLELTPGCDVIEVISLFACRHNVGICVLSARGSVANVTLRHPSSPHASTFTLHGLFHILSLSGTFLSSFTSSPPQSPSSFSPPAAATVAAMKSSFTISLSGIQGQVIGGTVAGALIAAGPVVLVAASFVNPPYHRLHAEEEETEDMHPSVIGTDPGTGSSMPMPVYSIAAPHPLNSQLPADISHWCGSSRPPSY